MAAVAVGDGGRGRVDALGRHQRAVGGRAEQLDGAALGFGHQVGRVLLRAFDVAVAEHVVALAEAVILLAVARVHQGGAVRGRGLGDVVGRGEVARAVVGRGHPGAGAAGAGLGGDGAAGHQPVGHAAVEHRHLVVAEHLELPVGAQGLVHRLGAGAGGDQHDRLAGVDAGRLHGFLEHGLLGDHVLHCLPGDLSLAAQLAHLEQAGAGNVAAHLDQLALAGLGVGLDLGRGGPGLGAAAHVDHLHVGQVVGQPLAVHQRAGQGGGVCCQGLQREGGDGRAAGQKAFHGESPR